MQNKKNYDKSSVTSTHDAISELLLICQISDYTDRTERVEKWINDWFLEVDFEQKVLNKRYLSTIDHDDMCDYIVGRCVQDFIYGDAAKFDIKSTSFAVKLTALRNKKK